jgi:hypothetical protein
MRLKRTLALAVASITASLGLGAIASPAQAALSDCTPNVEEVCLWQNINYGAGLWKSSFTNIYINHNGCLNLRYADYDNGDPLYDTSASLAIRASVGSVNYFVKIYEWQNCNEDGRSKTFTTYANTQVPHLGTYNPTWYHTIASIRVGTF